MAAHFQSLPFSVDLRRVNRAVGYVAVLLPLTLLALTVFGGLCFRASISHYYFSRLGGDVFVGALVFIGLLLAFLYDFGPARPDGYLQHRKCDLWLAKLAGFCALAVALIPTTESGCVYQSAHVARVFLVDPAGAEAFHAPASHVTGVISHDFWASFAGFGTADRVPAVLQAAHVTLAGVMLTILAYFSFFVFTRANSSTSSGPVSPGSRKALRNRLYRVLGLAIAFAVVAITAKTALMLWALNADQAATVDLWWDGLRLTFVLETLALISFGLSWLIKGRFINRFEDETVATQLASEA